MRLESASEKRRSGSVVTNARISSDGRVPGATLSSSVQSASILRRRTNASALSRSSATNPDIARGGTCA